MRSIKCITIFCVLSSIIICGYKSHVKDRLTYVGKSDMPNIVLVSGDEEYRSEEALPQLARILSKTHGFNCTVLFAQDSIHFLSKIYGKLFGDNCILFTDPEPQIVPSQSALVTKTSVPQLRREIIC